MNPYVEKIRKEIYIQTQSCKYEQLSFTEVTLAPLRLFPLRSLVFHRKETRAINKKQIKGEKINRRTLEL